MNRASEDARRPLSDDQRQQLFGLIAVVLVLATAALSVLGRPAAPTSSTSPSATTAPAPTAPVTAPSRSETERRAQTTTRPAPTAARAPGRVRRVARRFVAGYLRFVYERASARQLIGATRRLRRGLRTQRVRVPATARHRRARLRELDAGRRVADLAGAWVLRARIAEDRTGEYPLELVVARRHGRLVVVQIGAE